jgi:hypothetical protein
MHIRFSKKILFPFLFVCSIFHFNNSISAQGIYPEIPKGSVVINESDEIKRLIQNYIEENNKKKGSEGFRVQILSESGNDAKKKALEMKTSFLGQFPIYPAYLLFQTPNFKIRVGDFRTKLEAYRCMKQIKSGFPNAFVVKDDIQFPNLD